MRPPTSLVTLVTTASFVALLTVLPGAATGVAAKPTPEQRYGRQAVTASNNARAQHDLRELRVNDCLKGFARKQAKAMAAKEEMYHQDLGPIMSTCGLSTVGENVAYGYATGRSVVWDGWMESEGHRANILSTSYRLVAVAARRSSDGTWYAAQVFGRA
jgi:uncharacterized protein YkwD